MRLPLLLSCLAVAATACSDEVEWFPDDLDRQQMISVAGEAAAAQACDAFEAYLIDQYRASMLTDIACAVIAIDASEDETACKAAVKACKAEPPTSVDALITSLVDAASCGGLDYQPTSCSQTLGALADCLDATEVELRALKARLPCTLAGTPLPADTLTLATPAACETLETACPTPN